MEKEPYFTFLVPKWNIVESKEKKYVVRSNEN